MPIRTFLALDLDPDIRQRLLAVGGKLDCPGRIHWVGEPQLHVTIKFLGDVPDDLLADVCELASGAAEPLEAFDFDVRGVVAVPPRGEPRMLWAGVRDPPGQMARLHAALDDALAGLGLHEEEREFKPHITLARVKYVRDPATLRLAADALRDADFGVQHCDELVVYTSQLTPDGPIYTAAHRVKLGNNT